MLISIAHAAETAGHAADAAHGPFYTDPTFWVAVAFVATVAFLFKKVSAGVTGGLDARRDKIKARIEEAQKLRDEAQDLLAQYQRKQRDALKEAEEIVAAAKAEAERLSAQAARDLDELLKRREQQALDRIAQAEAKAASEVRNVAVDVAVAATRKVIAESITDKQATTLVDKAIGDLAAKLH